MGVGKCIDRVDAAEKVSGGAKYTDDFPLSGALCAKLVRSTIDNGLVISFGLGDAIQVPGVVNIFTCFDVPPYRFPTPGHPWSTEKSHQDVCDRLLLNQRVRIYGDEIAVVVAEDEVSAARAARLVKAEYDEYPVSITVEDGLKNTEHPNFEDHPDNVLAHSHYKVGDVPFDEAVSGDGLTVIDKTYRTQTVQHCHIEPPISYAYMENGRVTVVTSTQIPHIVRRVIGQALGMPFGKFRVIKPYIGGGFGNKQEVLYEPLIAWLCLKLGGRPVKISISREETFFGTRVRHAIDFHLIAAVNSEGRLVARKVDLKSNQGGYASHGHSICAKASGEFRWLYNDEKTLEADAWTIFTNIPTGGAMRGYGIPQVDFAMESQMDDLAAAIGMDPLEFRLKNCVREGYVDRPFSETVCSNDGLIRCIEKGRKYMDWDRKRAEYGHDKGDLRRGVGAAIFAYNTGVYPISLETASARVVLNQDGTAQVMMGATEIGQGADTVFTQMAAEELGFDEGDIHIISTQDTDVSPFDTGAYASRQTYVSGSAIKQTAAMLKVKILDYASEMLGRKADELDIIDSVIVEKTSGNALLKMSELAIEAFYSRTHSVHLTAESTFQCKSNAFCYGACFAEITVDVPLGKIKVDRIINIHDSGTLINPKLAEAQIHGGMSMGLGYALGEQLLFDKSGRVLNGNLLDYKLPTAMDTPELKAEFVELADPTGPYGNKALGEPPAVPVAPAIRNALLHATGVAVDSIPLSPQKLVEAFTAAGLIGGERHV